ncbi:MAG: glycosyltransferase [Chthoniobacterales bacterium]
MKFILYSHFTEDVIQDHLGEPEYGYYFVLRAFRPVLGALGSVEIVRRPETEVDPIFEECRTRGEPCLFLPFAAPGRIPLDLKCPTVPVVAWGLSTFPGAAPDEDCNIWRLALKKTGAAIALSRFSARVVAEAMGPDFRMGAVPPPIPARMDDSSPMEMESGGAILDTAAMNLDVNVLAPAARPGKGDSGAIERPSLSPGRDAHSSEPRARTSAGGVVYTAVLNPNDGNNNPSDLVTAFCWAFREIADATLVLKVCNYGFQAFSSRLIPILYQLSPFKCRVLVNPGFLPDLEYEKLIRATTYYVNASNSEGLCLPLMEFMSCGKPAIAPAHTAMSDYIDNDVAFVLRASRQITSWPDDPHGLFRAMSFRLDWESLRDAYRQSYQLAKDNPGGYREMSKRAREKMQGYASPALVTEQLRSFFSADAALTEEGYDVRHSASEGLAGRG